MIPSQMLKGTLEGCVLAIIGMKETYGYEISEQLEAHGFGPVAEGTIYPLLLRLEKGGLISATYKASGAGAEAEILCADGKGRAGAGRVHSQLCRAGIGGRAFAARSKRRRER